MINIPREVPADKLPLEVKFQARTPGHLQNRALALQERLPPGGGAEVIAEVARTGRHTGQLALEIIADGLPLIRSYGAAVPALTKTSEEARKISIRKGLGGDIEPSFTRRIPLP